MILADHLPPALGIVIAVALLVGLVVFSIWFFRTYERHARRSLERTYLGLAVHSLPEPGDVIVTYHTYHGFLAWFTQTPHLVVLPPDDARRLLGRLLGFNLTWGLVTWGGVLVAPLAIVNYFAQRRSIAHQEATGGIPASAIQAADATSSSTANSEEVPVEAVVASRSLFRQFVGGIAAGLCILCALSVLACLTSGEFSGAVASAVLTVLLGWVARDWLGKPKH